MGTALFFFALAIGLAAIGISVNSEKNKTSPDKSIEEIKKLNDFTISQCIKVPDPVISTVVAVDNDRHKVVFAYNDGSNISIEMFSASDILESELIENNQSVIKTSRSSQVAGAAVGGILFGGLGAVVGGVTGKKVETVVVDTVGVRVTVNNLASPVRNYYFLNSPVPKNSPQYNSAISQATHWHGVFSALIKNI